MGRAEEVAQLHAAAGVTGQGQACRGNCGSAVLNGSHTKMHRKNAQCGMHATTWAATAKPAPHLQRMRMAWAPRSTTSSVLPAATSGVLCGLDSARSAWLSTSWNRACRGSWLFGG